MDAMGARVFLAEAEGRERSQTHMAGLVFCPSWEQKRTCAFYPMGTRVYLVEV